MIRQLHLTRITREPGGPRGLDIEEHLVGGRGNHMNRTIAYLHRGPLGMRSAGREEPSLWGQADTTLRDNGFQPFHRFFIWSTADIARAVVVIVREHAADFAVLNDACSPIALISLMIAIPLSPDKSTLLAAQAEKLLNVLLIEWLTALPGLLQFPLQRTDLLFQIRNRRIARFHRQRLAEIGLDAPAIATGIEAREDAFAIGSNPDAHIERGSFRRFLQRLPASR